MFKAHLISATFLIALSGADAQAAEPVRCTVVVDAKTGENLYRQGTCDQDFYPQSTFKLPLAIMGYDAGILKDSNTPLWKYQNKFGGPQRVRKDVDPTIWEKDSIVWYSQEITRKLGSQVFANYVRGFGYGNGDVSGGLTQAWLASSLRISPDQQVAFIRRFLNNQLPISASAKDKTIAIIPSFEAKNGWKVQGKTGSGSLRNGAGKPDYSRPIGWFVGWAVKGERQVVFARLLVDTKRHPDTPISFTVRDTLVADLPSILGGR